MLLWKLLQLTWFITTLLNKADCRYERSRALLVLFLNPNLTPDNHQNHTAKATMSFSGANEIFLTRLLNDMSLSEDKPEGRRQTIIENRSIKDRAAYHQKRWPSSGNEDESQTTRHSTHINRIHTGRASLRKIFDIW